MVECVHPGCEKPKGSYRNGYCPMHHYRFTNGRPMDKMQEKRGLPLSERFWQHVDIREPDECWPWKAHCGRGGYGQFVLYPPDVPRKRTAIASRVAYALAHGSEPANMACHHCDNPPCCNPAHIYDGDSKQNTGDMYERKRDPWSTGVLTTTNPPRGEAHSRAEVTEEEVRAIRTRYRTVESGRRVSQQVLAEEYGIDQTQVSRIVRRKAWAHVD